MEETQVIALVRQGDSGAFTEIVEHYQLPISRYIQRLTGDTEMTKDLTQDTFIKAYRGILDTDSEISLKAWLYRIATNTVLDHKRRKGLISFIPFTESSKNDTVNEYSSLSGDERLAVQDTLLKIGHDRRACLVLHYVEGLKYREIADILGITEDGVRKRVLRGSEEFQKLYLQGGGELI